MATSRRIDPELPGTNTAPLGFTRKFSTREPRDRDDFFWAESWLLRQVSVPGALLRIVKPGLKDWVFADAFGQQLVSLS
jgi:hypothetical protein